MFNMPRIWLDYAQFAARCQLVTKTRTIYDQALQALPVTQHKMIWSSYVQWAIGLSDHSETDDERPTFSATALHVYKRYIKLNGQAREELIAYLLSVGKIEEALPIYEEIVSLTNFNAKSGKTIAEFEIEMCEFISKFPDMCFKLKKSPIAIMRNLIQEKYKEATSGLLGQLWNYLAQFFIRLGQFGLARDIFEEALDREVNGIKTVRDFAIVYNSYLKFERSLLTIEHEIDLENAEELKASDI
jgi:pre-mRNA-splicing factor SYF1